MDPQGMRRRARHVYSGDTSMISSTPTHEERWRHSSYLEVDTPPNSTALVCPVCLSESPAPPIMTPCGHVYCLCCWTNYCYQSHATLALEKAGGGVKKSGAQQPPPGPHPFLPAAFTSAMRASVPCPVCSVWCNSSDYKHVQFRHHRVGGSATSGSAPPTTLIGVHTLPSLAELCTREGAVVIPPSSSIISASMGGKTASYLALSGNDGGGGGGGGGRGGGGGGGKDRERKGDKDSGSKAEWVLFRLVALLPRTLSATSPPTHPTPILKSPSPVILSYDSPPSVASEGACYSPREAKAEAGEVREVYQRVARGLAQCIVEFEGEASEARERVHAIVASLGGSSSQHTPKLGGGSSGGGGSSSGSGGGGGGGGKGAWGRGLSSHNASPSLGGGDPSPSLSSLGSGGGGGGGSGGGGKAAWGDKGKVNTLVTGLRASNAPILPVGSGALFSPHETEGASPEELQLLSRWSEVVSSCEFSVSLANWVKERVEKEVGGFLLTASSGGSGGGGGGDATKPPSSPSTPSPLPSGTLFAYQCAAPSEDFAVARKGCHGFAAEWAFLHPLCLKVLLELGGIAAVGGNDGNDGGGGGGGSWDVAVQGLPPYLAAPALAVETVLCSPEFLKRNPFFSHFHASFPGTPLHFVEVDITRSLCHGPFPVNVPYPFPLFFPVRGGGGGQLEGLEELGRRTVKRRSALGGVHRKSSRKTSVGSEGSVGGGVGGGGGGVGGGGGGKVITQQQLFKSVMGISNIDEEDRWLGGITNNEGGRDWEWEREAKPTAATNAGTFFPSLPNSSPKGKGGGGSGGGVEGGRASPSAVPSKDGLASIFAEQKGGGGGGGSTKPFSFRDVAGQRAATTAMFPALGGK